jgi:hypothetical protein
MVADLRFEPPITGNLRSAKPDLAFRIDANPD